MNRRETILAAIAMPAAGLPVVRPLSDEEAWRAGVDLAIELFNETDMDENGFASEFREGRPQDNILLRYLVRLRETNDPRVEAAFAAVLSDFVSSGCGGFVTDTEYYEHFRDLSSL